ncbi:Mn2+-dependent serine/threonine protein kinase [Pyrobaculum islandicum DSM 4184]|uniref:non-specific serine/threonine protein kinase n=1 Tax=Pyrobaculum islandicum (strain DSM 4184 / JCM 9189 / GEO3) TaxID=384616 RepID=A1RSR9_PYRIL|nr:KEOPS complex kinase/ATPase Bud32 [Pyrobaculum islandicum]ABL88001.1 Mn2+-dependent serine/threonine protein kinase [Pyrobaculum islandicum DSM 4184]
MILIAKGAEAEIYLVDWFGIKAVLKWRKPKAYRDHTLDYLIRRRRTINEVRNMYIAHVIGVRVPAVYFFDPEKTTILMEYVEGESLRDLLSRGEHKYLKDVGIYIGKMHKAGLIHGDLAPTNIILSKGELYFIDFGLGETRRGWTRKTAILMARDINVLLRTLELYGAKSEEFKSLFWSGYREEMGVRSSVVESEVSRIRASGRYVER